MSVKKSKHAAVFNSNWQRGRPWLRYIHGQGMFCQTCQEFDKKPFDRDTWNKTPCKRLRLESITDHEKTVAHTDSLKLKAEIKLQSDISIEIFPAVSSSSMAKTSACLYFLYKQLILSLYLILLAS